MIESALTNLQAVCEGLTFLGDIRRRHKRYEKEARDELWLMSTRSRVAARKRRLQLVFEARNQKGLTFREIGEIIHVGAAQASNLYHIACAYAGRGKLYSANPRMPYLKTEVIEER